MAGDAGPERPNQPRVKDQQMTMTEPTSHQPGTVRVGPTGATSSTPATPHTVRGPHRYPTHTALGHILFIRGITVSQFSYATHINTRILTEYLAGRLQPKPDNLVRMAEALQCHPDQLRNPAHPWTVDIAHAHNLKNQAKEQRSA